MWGLYQKVDFFAHFQYQKFCGQKYFLLPKKNLKLTLLNIFYLCKTTDFTFRFWSHLCLQRKSQQTCLLQPITCIHVVFTLQVAPTKQTNSPCKTFVGCWLLEKGSHIRDINGGKTLLINYNQQVAYSYKNILYAVVECVCSSGRVNIVVLIHV